MHFNAAFIALLAAAAGVNAATLEDRTSGPPPCAELCFKKAISVSQCQNQKHYIRNLWVKKSNWECLCKDQQFHETVVPCCEQQCKKPKDLLLVKGFMGKTCGYSNQQPAQGSSQGSYQAPQAQEQPSKSQYKARDYNKHESYQAPKEEYKQPAKKPESYQAPKQQEYKPVEKPVEKPKEYKPVEQPKQEYQPKKQESYQASKAEHKPEASKEQYQPKKQESYQPKHQEEYQPKKQESHQAPKEQYQPKKQEQYQQQAPKQNY
ncbi:hypothetical protein PG993_000822 [Apiospora rasikravindrae]|uniref:CFEM domain-containing protein n=1 Tax=Apiospora rasikravindrae TaxID=990691 RepID=A0ABR1UBX2_9PEZI